MSLLPKELIPWLLAVAPLFSKPVWASALVLLVGALVAPGKRAVSALLRVMGRQHASHVQNDDHRVLSWALWSRRQVSRSLLQPLVTVFAPTGGLVMGMDDTIERRWGKRLAASGSYRDPVRSSASPFVKTSGLQWLSWMLLVNLPWAKRVWALPFCTVLAPSERDHQRRQRHHQTLLDWAHQRLTQVRRWRPQRTMVLVADRRFAALDCLDVRRQLPAAVAGVTRLRLDAALSEPAPERQPNPLGRPRKVGHRLPTLKARLKLTETTWQTVTMEGWYGGRTCQLQVTADPAVWDHTGLPAVPMRWVLVEDPTGQLEPQALRSTDRHAIAKQSLLWLVNVGRWQ